MDPKWYHVCWPRLTAKCVEPVVSISWASCFLSADNNSVGSICRSDLWADVKMLADCWIIQGHSQPRRSRGEPAFGGDLGVGVGRVFPSLRGVWGRNPQKIFNFKNKILTLVHCWLRKWALQWLENFLASMHWRFEAKPAGALFAGSPCSLGYGPALGQYTSYVNMYM